MRFAFSCLILFLCSLQLTANETSEEVNNVEENAVLFNMPLSEVSRVSKIASKYVSGAGIPEVTVKPNRKAKISLQNNYKSAMLRRKLWSEVVKTMESPIIGYNITLSEEYIKSPPPIQAFMKSELPVEINCQCLNAFNYLSAYPGMLTCTPTPSNELLEILIRYICMKSVTRIFKNWTGSIFILRDIIEKSIYFSKSENVPLLVIDSLKSEYNQSQFKDFVPIARKVSKQVNSDVEGRHIWRFIVARSRLLYSIDSPTRAPRRGEWAFVLVSGNKTPKEFLYLREIRFVRTGSAQLNAAVLFALIIFKVKNPTKFKSYDVIIEDYNKKLKKVVNSNLLLAFAARIATDYSYISNDWNDQIDTLLEIDLEEKKNNRTQTFIWHSRPFVSLLFEPDIAIPDQLVSNCVRYCEDMVSNGVVSVVGADPRAKSSSFLQKKLETICKKLQEKILPYTDIYVEPAKIPLKSILKSPTKPSDSGKKKLRFNNNVYVSVYEKGGMITDRTPESTHPLDVSLKTSLENNGRTTAKPEIPIEHAKEHDSVLDDPDMMKIDMIDSLRDKNEGLFDKTPYPHEEDRTKPTNVSENIRSGNLTTTLKGKEQP